MDQEDSCSTLSFFPPDSFSDLDSSFTSSTTSASTFSARSSLNLSLPSFSSSTAPLHPHPHHRSDPHWSALRAVSNLSPDGLLHLRHIRIVRPLGSGHLARVFHCRLQGFDDAAAGADFALKVIDLDALSRSSIHDSNVGDYGDDSKLWHVRAEAQALAVLDHPFLPTLYARLEASHYACFLIDYCPGGDLHSILRRRRGHSLPLSAARFYAAEVLLALEYLHALGFVYRDLKPENVLLRADGHIMLSDFDLSFQSDVSSSVIRHRPTTNHRRRLRRYWCFGGSSSTVSNFEVVAEPKAAFSRACVGTHEYLAPEVISANGHGSAVDWWAFGVFLYELLYGKTPFKGGSKESTLRNILTSDISFPEDDDVDVRYRDDMAKARDLISRLMVRDPAQRMGASGGAAEIRRHPFFDGVRWPLIRSTRPPVVVGPAGIVCGPRSAREAKEEGSQGRGRWWWSSWSKSEVISANDKKKKTKLMGFVFGLGA